MLWSSPHTEWSKYCCFRAVEKCPRSLVVLMWLFDLIFPNKFILVRYLCHELAFCLVVVGNSLCMIRLHSIWRWLQYWKLHLLCSWPIGGSPAIHSTAICSKDAVGHHQRDTTECAGCGGHVTWSLTPTRCDYYWWVIVNNCYLYVLVCVPVFLCEYVFVWLVTCHFLNQCYVWMSCILLMWPC